MNPIEPPANMVLSDSLDPNNQLLHDFPQRLNTLAETANKYLESKGYNVVSRNGQRISTLALVDLQPDGHNEVFVGKIPREMFENELLPVMETAGRVYKIRLMMDFSGTNRGFGYVNYMTAREAAFACEFLKKVQLHPDEPPMVVLMSFDNKRLYFGNLPPKCTREQLIKELNQILEEDVEDAEMSEGSLRAQRRFAIVTFKSHDAATKARRLLVPGDVKMFNRVIQVDWAKPTKTDSPLKLDRMPLAPRSPHHYPFRSIDFNNNIVAPTESSIRQLQTAQVIPAVLLKEKMMNSNSNLMVNNDILVASAKSTQDHSSNLHASAFQTLIADSILGERAKQMLASTEPYLDPACCVTINNINPLCANVEKLKRIFELNGQLNVVDVRLPNSRTVVVCFASKDQADLILSALVSLPNCFNGLTLPNQNLMPSKGSSSQSILDF